MMATATLVHQPTRSPMSSLHSQDNIPLLQSPPPKSIQLGIEAFTTKREHENSGHPRIKKVRTANDPHGSQNAVPSVICHQCRQHVHPHLSVRCTVLKTAGLKNPSTKRCSLIYCQRCVLNRYNEQLMDIIEAVPSDREGHDPDAEYCWKCPACRGACNCSHCRKKYGLAPLGPMVVRKTSAEGTEKVKEKPRKKKEKSAGQGIQSFFPKIDPNDRRTPEAAKVPADEDLETQETQSTSQPPPKRLISRKRKAPTLKVVEPPTFHPVRASIPDSSFLHHLKAREFVLRFEKVFTRKLHVPAKHIVSLGDPCDIPSPLAIKHLFAALFKIIQVDLTEKDELELMKETLKKVEKSTAGHENILLATRDWLATMGDKLVTETEMEVACKLIDWAVGTSVCRNEMESDIEKLKTLKSENVAAIKTLRTEYEDKKAELHKERLRIVEKDLVEQWKQDVAELDKQHKADMSNLSATFWIESRYLSPRTGPLGTDILGNKYWVFTSRKTKTRDFGGWLVIQTEGQSPCRTTTTTTNPFDPPPDEQVGDSDDTYSPLKSWYYVESAEDLRRLPAWTTYLAAKASLAQERAEKKPRGSPNRLGQSFAVEVPSSSSSLEMKIKGPGKGRRVQEVVGMVETRMLCEELGHVAEWIEERWPEEEEEVEQEDEKPMNGNEVEIDGEIIVLDP